MSARISRRTLLAGLAAMPTLALVGCEPDRTTAGPISTTDTLDFANRLRIPALAESTLDDNGVRVFRLSAISGSAEFLPRLSTPAWSYTDGRYDEVLEKGNSFSGHNKLLGAEMLGYTSAHFFSSGHVIYPLLRPAMEELFEQFKPAFLADAEYRFRNRKQFWPISAHDHLLLKSDRARVVKPRDAAHFSVRYCLQASPDALEARLQQLGDGTTRIACINHLEAVVDKVPHAMDYLSKATRPAAAFERPARDTHVSRLLSWRRR